MCSCSCFCASVINRKRKNKNEMQVIYVLTLFAKNIIILINKKPSHLFDDEVKY
jgi:hypothetical protein